MASLYAFLSLCLPSSLLSASLSFPASHSPSYSLSVFAYRTALHHLRIGNHHEVPNEPQRIVGRKRAKEMHVQRDAGTLQRSARQIQRESKLNLVAVEVLLWQEWSNLFYLSPQTVDTLKLSDTFFQFTPCGRGEEKGVCRSCTQHISISTLSARLTGLPPFSHSLSYSLTLFALPFHSAFVEFWLPAKGLQGSSCILMKSSWPRGKLMHVMQIVWQLPALTLSLPHSFSLSLCLCLHCAFVPRAVDSNCNLHCKFTIFCLSKLDLRAKRYLGSYTL